MLNNMRLLKLTYNLEQNDVSPDCRVWKSQVHLLLMHTAIMHIWLVNSTKMSLFLRCWVHFPKKMSSMTDCVIIFVFSFWVNLFVKSLNETGVKSPWLLLDGVTEEIPPNFPAVFSIKDKDNNYCVSTMIKYHAQYETQKSLLKPNKCSDMMAML